MRVGMAYIAVVVIWSTTPLAIKWSNSSLTFITAVSIRVLGALLVCAFLFAILKRPVAILIREWRVYCVSVLGLFPNALLVYWSAQYIPSGLASVLFGFYPFVVGAFSHFILHENIFNVRRVLALLLALSGLVIINITQLDVEGDAIYGILGMLCATVFFGLSSVLLKKIGSDVDPISKSTGTFLFAAPLFIFVWSFFDGQVPVDVDARSMSGVIYLILAGSVVGGTLFFYVLKKCSVASVGAITFITPVMSLFLGAVVDGESLSSTTLMGCIFIVFSLILYQGVVVKAYSKYFLPKNTAT